MKISVIIPIYNVAPYIERCILSIVSQSYQPYECILIDDCGTDGSIDYIEQFIHNYDGEIRFTVIRHQQNMGPSAARNTGIKVAKGNYVYFMDSDDAITPDCIETLLTLAERYPQADYVQGDIVTGDKNLMEGYIDTDVPDFVNDKQQLENIILNKSHRTAWNKLIKRSFLLDNKLFFPIGLVMEDHYWTYFVAQKAHAVAFAHTGTYYYYNNAGSIVNSRSRQHYIRNYSSYMTIIDTITNDLCLRDDVQHYHRQYVGEAVLFCMMHLARLHSLRHWWKFWKFMSRITYKQKEGLTGIGLFFFFCMMPPLCYIVNIKGWNWRLRQHIIPNL